MQTMRMFIMVALLGTITACKPAVDASEGKTGSAEAEGDVADLNANAVAKPKQAEQLGVEPGGAFAREPGFQLPVPVSSTPVRADTMPQSRQVDPAGVRAAVMEGLGEVGGNVQVQVSPTGIVSLSGEVGSVAEMQNAHYLARAQPGVVEVEYRNLRVRQR